MTLLDPLDALNLPDGRLDVVRPTLDGPAVETVQIQDGDVLEAIQLLKGQTDAVNLDFSTKSEILAVAINQFDFRKEFFEAFAT
jgi:hypothetical protein